MAETTLHVLVEMTVEHPDNVLVEETLIPDLTGSIKKRMEYAEGDVAVTDARVYSHEIVVSG